MFVIKLVYIWNDYLTTLEIGQILGKKNKYFKSAVPLFIASKLALFTSETNEYNKPFYADSSEKAAAVIS